MTTDRTPDSDREAAIRARLEAAADGPLIVDTAHGNSRNYFVIAPDHYQVAMTQHPEDAELFANAPADLDYLLTALSEARASLAAAEAVTPLEWRDAPGHAQFESEEAWQDTGQRWAIWHDRSTIDDSGYELSTLDGQSYATLAKCTTLAAAQTLAARLDAVLREEGA